MGVYSWRHDDTEKVDFGTQGRFTFSSKYVPPGGIFKGGSEQNTITEPRIPTYVAFSYRNRCIYFHNNSVFLFISRIAFRFPFFSSLRSASPSLPVFSPVTALVSHPLPFLCFHQ